MWMDFAIDHEKSDAEINGVLECHYPCHSGVIQDKGIPSQGWSAALPFLPLKEK